MKKLCVKLLAALLAAVLLTTLAPAALMEADFAPVEMIDEAVPEMDSVELDGDAELPVEDGAVSGEDYMAGLRSFEATGEIPIDEAHFPDPNFRLSISNGFDRDRSGTLSQSEIESATYMQIDCTITSFQGIEYLTNLEGFVVSHFDGPALELDFRGIEKLTSVSVSDSAIASVHISGCVNLQTLYLYNCVVNVLDISGLPNLTKVVGPGTQLLTELNASGCGSLLNLEGFAAIQAASVNLSGCTGLTETFNPGGYFQSVQSMDLSGCTGITNLWVNIPSLTSLNVSGCTNLVQVFCTNTGLTSLDLSNCPTLAGSVKDAVMIGNRDGSVSFRVSADGYPVYLTCEKGLTIIGPSWTIVAEPTEVSKDKKDTSDQKDTTDTTDTTGTTDATDTSAPAATPAVPEGFTEVEGKTNAEVTVAKGSTAAKTTATVVAAPGSVTQLDLSGAKAKKIKSSDKKVATVNSKGVVTFKKAGKVTITATTKRGNKKAKVKFTVSK